MNFTTKSHKTQNILKIALVTITILVTSFAYLFLFSTGIVPIRYLVVLGGMIIAVLLLIAFLLFKQFRRRTLLARIIAVVIAIIVLGTSVLGHIAIRSGLSILDKFTDSDNAVKIETSKTFNVYISGIDTYGDLSVISRSDVNIVATVDPVNHKILLTTIPRDSYVSIALGGNDQMDKLTHAGNYGVESSMKTVARLLDTPIDTYIRVNFTSFVQVIDELGGVTISNPVAFDADGEHFGQGNITLDGRRALIYSRERKGLQGGDNDRGKNQQRVIQGVIDGISGTRSLQDLDSLLQLLSESVDTNISNESVRALINQQINDTKGWTTESIALEGRGQLGGLPSYAMPGSELYMFVLDEDSLATVRQKIADMRR